MVKVGGLGLLQWNAWHLRECFFDVGVGRRRGCRRRCRGRWRCRGLSTARCEEQTGGRQREQRDSQSRIRHTALLWWLGGCPVITAKSSRHYMPIFTYLQFWDYFHNLGPQARNAPPPQKRKARPLSALLDASQSPDPGRGATPSPHTDRTVVARMSLVSTSTSFPMCAAPVYVKFGWVMDPQGNEVELWQPPPGQ